MTPFIASRWTVQNRSPGRARLTHCAQAAVCSCDRAKLTQRAMQSNYAVSAASAQRRVMWTACLVAAPVASEDRRPRAAPRLRQSVLLRDVDPGGAHAMLRFLAVRLPRDHGNKMLPGFKIKLPRTLPCDSPHQPDRPWR